MSENPTPPQHGAPTRTQVGAPTKHQLALMIWVATQIIRAS